MLPQNVIFRANSQQHVRAQSKNLYCCKRDVSTTVDMTSLRFFRMRVNITKNCYSLQEV